MYIILICNTKNKYFEWLRTGISTMECLKFVVFKSCTSNEYSAKEYVSVIHIANELIVQLKAHLKTKFK